MKTLFKISSVLIVLLLFSCQGVKDSRVIAEKFYEYRKKQQNEQVEELLSKEFLAVTSAEEFKTILDEIDFQLGEIVSYKSGNFRINTQNGVTYTSFVYNVEYEKGTLKDSLVLIKTQKDGFKLLYYSYEVVD